MMDSSGAFRLHSVVQHDHQPIERERVEQQHHRRQQQQQQQQQQQPSIATTIVEATPSIALASSSSSHSFLEDISTTTGNNNNNIINNNNINNSNITMNNSNHSNPADNIAAPDNDVSTNETNSNSIRTTTSTTNPNDTIVGTIRYYSNRTSNDINHNNNNGSVEIGPLLQPAIPLSVSSSSPSQRLSLVLHSHILPDEQQLLKPTCKTTTNNNKIKIKQQQNQQQETDSHPNENDYSENHDKDDDNHDNDDDDGNENNTMLDDSTDSDQFSKFRCRICYEYMEEPTTCGHCAGRFCYQCLVKTSVNNNSNNNNNNNYYSSTTSPNNHHHQTTTIAACPTCRKTFFQCQLDESLQLEMEQTGRRPCRYQHCTARLALHQIRRHEEMECPAVRCTCPFARVGCTVTGPRYLIQQHIQIIAFNNNNNTDQQQQPTIEPCPYAQVPGLVERVLLLEQQIITLRHQQRQHQQQNQLEDFDPMNPFHTNHNTNDNNNNLTRGNHNNNNNHIQSTTSMDDRVNSLERLVEYQNTVLQQHRNSKSLSNPFDLLAFLFTLTWTTPHFLSCRHVWNHFYATPEGRAAVFNFASFWPTVALVCKVIVESYQTEMHEIVHVAEHTATTTTSMHASTTTSATSLPSAVLFIESFLTTTLKLRDPDTTVQELLQQQCSSGIDWLNQLCSFDFGVLKRPLLKKAVGILGLAVAICFHFDGSSVLRWKVHRIPFVGAHRIGLNIAALTLMALYYLMMVYHGGTLLPLTVWCWVAISSVLFPKVVGAISVAAAGFQPSTPVTGRAAKPLRFALRYGLVTYLFGLLPCLDAIACLHLVRHHYKNNNNNSSHSASRNWWTKNCFFVDVIFEWARTELWGTYLVLRLIWLYYYHQRYHQQQQQQQVSYYDDTTMVNNNNTSSNGILYSLFSLLLYPMGALSMLVVMNFVIGWLGWCGMEIGKKIYELARQRQAQVQQRRNIVVNNNNNNGTGASSSSLGSNAAGGSHNHSSNNNNGNDVVVLNDFVGWGVAVGTIWMFIIVFLLAT